MTENPEENLKNNLIEFIIDYHKSELVKILKNPDPSLYYAVFIDLCDLMSSANTALFQTDANLFFSKLNESLIDAQKLIIEEHANENLNLLIKNKISARLASIPEANGIFVKYPECSNINKLVCFNGTVTKTFSPRMLESTQTYQCGKCGHEFTVKIDYGNKDLLVKPSKCPNNDCQSDKFKCVNLEKNLKTIAKDYQEIKVQEKLDVYSAGTIPKSIIVVLENDLVDCCKPGDDVTINAIVIQRWGRLIENMRCDIELILLANFIKVNNEEQTQLNITKEKEKIFFDFWKKYETRPFTGRNIILRSLCPQLYGMYIVKLAVCLVLAGGVSRNDPTGTRVRGESHLLLAGDPGTGKSQFLKYANKIIPKSVLTTGMGSTSAGLTAAASREGGLWHLEAGALVLADGGICCVDEFNCMKEQEKMSMLEAMEQQSISVAKAGIVCKLRTQCSVLAACNPKGHYDPSQPVTINLAMSSPLLSRFDVILLLLDTPNEEWDHLASTFLLEGIDLLSKDKDKVDVWDFDQLRLYINYVKSLEPNLTDDANFVIQKYYQLQRKSDERNAARTTVRMLESVIRLSQAHAKIMLRNEVLIMDAIVAITLVECSLNRTASFGNVNILHTSFPEDAEVEYQSQVDLILKRLNLDQTLLPKEMKFIEQKFEPFCKNTYDSTSKPTRNSNHNLNLTMQNFDIISQMVGDVPTQTFQANGSKFSSTINNQGAKSFDFERSISHINKSCSSNSSDDIKVHKEFEDQFNYRKRKFNDLSVLSDETNKKNLNQSSSTDESGKTDTLAKKTKLDKPSTSLLSKFAYVPREEQEQENIEDKQNNSIIHSNINKENKSSNQTSQAQTKLNTQSKSEYERSQLIYSQKLAEKVNPKNIDFQDEDLQLDLD